MYGHLFIGLKEYVESEFDADTWITVINKSGSSSADYKVLLNYPDSEFTDLISAFASVTGNSVPATMELFGKYMAHFFTRMYGVFFKEDWNFFDLMEHVEDTMHRNLRMYNPGLHPPELAYTRISTDEVSITYNSHRKLCTFAIGLIKGFAEHYKEKISVTEKTCLLQQDNACRISIKVVK